MHTRAILKTLLMSGALALASLASSNAFAEEINVGANIGNVPWEFQDASGKFVGFEVDLVNEVGKRLGKTVEIVNIPFQGLFAAVQSGQIDAAVSSITITQKRLDSVTFAQPYYDSDQSLTVTAASGITGLDGMEGKIVGGRHRLDRRHLGHRESGQVRLQRDPAATKACSRPCSTCRPAASTATSRDIPALLYYTKDKPQFKVVERIPTDREVLDHVRQGRAAGQPGQRRHHRR